MNLSSLTIAMCNYGYWPVRGVVYIFRGCCGSPHDIEGVISREPRCGVVESRRREPGIQYKRPDYRVGEKDNRSYIVSKYVSTVYYRRHCSNGWKDAQTF